MSFPETIISTIKSQFRVDRVITVDINSYLHLFNQLLTNQWCDTLKLVKYIDNVGHSLVFIGVDTRNGAVYYVYYNLLTDSFDGSCHVIDQEVINDLGINNLGING